MTANESVQTTDKYLGCKQRLQNAVNDRIASSPTTKKSEANDEPIASES